MYKPSIAAMSAAARTDGRGSHFIAFSTSEGGALRCGDELSENLAMPIVRRVLRLRRREMRRTHEHLETVRRESLEHSDGCLDVRRPVINARQKV